MKTGYVVLDLMTTKPITCSPDISITNGSKLMREHDIGSLLVLKDGDLVGILTEEDLVRKVLATGKSYESPISSIMSKEVISISPGVDIYSAVQTMNRYNIRHMPVVDDGKLVGYITLMTILKIKPQLFELVADHVSLRSVSPDSPFLKDDF